MQVLLDMSNDSNVDICPLLEAQLFSDWHKEPNTLWETTKKWCKLGDPQEVKLEDTKPQKRGQNKVIFCGCIIFHRYENIAMLHTYLKLEVFLWHSK